MGKNYDVINFISTYLYIKKVNFANYFKVANFEDTIKNCKFVS